MADQTSAPARQPTEQANPQNKYAQVLHQAAAKKRTRQDLEDDSWIRQRPSPAPPVFND